MSLDGSGFVCYNFVIQLLFRNFYFWEVEMGVDFHILFSFQSIELMWMSFFQSPMAAIYSEALV